MELFNKNNYYFIGIGGIGISAIARMLQLQGKKVSGSDSSESEITSDLAKLGMEVTIGQKAENIPEDTEVVIYTVAIPPENPEFAEAKKRGLVVVSYPEALGELSKNMFTIAISGTHGKTTVTAMVGHIMMKVGMDPTIIVGSKIIGENSNFHVGKSKYLVVEACEYKRSFLNLHPTILLINNIEAEHLDYYKDLQDIENAFQELASKVPPDGTVVREADYEKITPDFELLIPGQHNISNAKAAIKVAMAVGVEEGEAKKALETFRGTWRRLEYKGEKNGNTFYDDYAHHPSEIRASLLALKEKYPERELVCVFNPHTISRTKILFDDFVSALQIADRVFVTPIHITREVNDESISNTTLAEAINKFKPAKTVTSSEELKKELANIESGKPLCIVMMGAGNIYTWTQDMLDF